jgi:sodium-dependent dicarboxylate transporter 2/3/5
MVLRKLIANPETGIPLLFTNVFEPISKTVPFVVFLLISVGWALLQTQFMSNFVTMTLVYTVMMPLAVATGAGDPIALAWAVNTAACLAIIFPSGTVVSALIIGSGEVYMSVVVRYGSFMVLFILLLITFVVYPYASFVFGFFG